MADRDIPDEPPPPYPGPSTQSQPPYSQTAPSNAPPGAPANRVRSIPRQFPPAFNVYAQSFSRTMTLAEHQDHPFYALKFHSAWSSSAPLVLHSGPTDTFPTLAEVEFHAFSSKMTVRLPPPLGVPGGPPVDEEVLGTGVWNWKYSFSIEVGLGETRREHFEWHYSAGDAIAQLDGLRGWQLVRMATSPPPGMQGANFVPGGYTTDAGREIVAVFTDSVISLSKVLKFSFLGTGESGALGERWAIMAVTSALGIFTILRRAKQNRRH